MGTTSHLTGGRRWLAPLAAASGLIVIFVSVLSFPLSVAQTLSLSERETVGWITALYGVPGLLTIILVARCHQPLQLTGNIFLLIFVGSLGATEVLSRWLPAPIVYGVLAGAVLHFFIDLFTATGDEPSMVGGTLLVYLLSRRFLEPRVPALLTGADHGRRVGDRHGRDRSDPDEPGARSRVRDARTVALRAADRHSGDGGAHHGAGEHPLHGVPPERSVRPTRAAAQHRERAGSAASSLLGPVGVSLSLPATALCAGPDAGPHEHRYLAAYIAGTASLAIGLGAGFATHIAEALPASLLVAFVGLAVVGVLSAALQQVTAGPLVLGPLFAFGIAQSELELLDLGPFFWALAGGLLVSYLLEHDARRGS